MIYFISFILDYAGINNRAILFKLEDNYDLKLCKYLKLDYNPYGDIYIVSFLDVYYYYNYISTNMKPYFYYTLPSDEEQWWTYCIKILYHKSGYQSSYGNNVILKLALEDYKKHYGEINNVTHYIIVFNSQGRYKSIYLVEQIPIHEAIKVMKENEDLTLWFSL
jgi:hypothetical protein